MKFIRSKCDEGCDWCIYVTVVTSALNQVIARSEFEVQSVKFIRSKCDEGCDWCIYVTVVTSAGGIAPYQVIARSEFEVQHEIYTE